MSQIQLFVVLFVAVLQTYVSADEEPNLLTKLDCQPAEKRIFAYESNTQLWGPLDENFLVSADIIIHCLGKDGKGKYGTNALKYMVQIENLRPSVIKEKQNEITKKSRSKRGVGSWFKQAWVDVKDFFVTLFTKKKRNDDGIYFDFEKQPSSMQYQCKANKKDVRRKRAAPKPGPVSYDKMFSTPFVFIQLADGSIPEVRFSDKESDPTVKNFKRHIADAFATQLDASKQRVLEQSPIGAHFSSYSYDNTGKMEDSLQPTSDGQSLQLGASFMSLSQTKDLNHLSVMRDVTPDDMMEIGSNGMTYDASQIGVNAKQIQQINEGRVTTTAGHLSLSLVNPAKGSRTKRNTNENKEISDYLKVRTKYSLAMTKRMVKRSTDDILMLETLLQKEAKLNLKAEGMISESTKESTLKEKLLMTKKYINEKIENTKNSDNLVKYLSDQQSPIYSSLMKALNLEVMLNEDKTDTSVTHMIIDKINVNQVRDICGQKLSLKDKHCFDLLMILIKGQSTKAETLLFQELKADKSLEDKSEILKLIVQSPNPSDSQINRLLDMLTTQANKDNNFDGILLLAISNLGYRSKSDQMRRKIANILTDKLNAMNCNSEEDNSLLVDTLEAIGNLGYKSTITYSQRFGETCSQSDSIRIAAIHSCRRLITNHAVQKWFLKLLKERSNSCSVRQEVVNTFIEDINSMEMEMRAVNRWPKTEFNEIDGVLAEDLIEIKHNQCLQENIIRYFERKSNIKARVVLKKAKKLRTKREVFDSFWTESHCKDWVLDEDKKETPTDSEATVIISDRIREFEDMDSKTTFEKRRKCTATKRFGPSQAQAIFRADIVNDVSGPKDDPDYKLMAQFGAGTHFLGKDIDIGKMYVYHKKDMSRAYVNIFGNTLVDVATTHCNGTTLQPYITSNFLPLYDFSIWIVQMTLGVRMTAEMNFDLPNFNCDDKQAQQLKTVSFNPETKVRASGEVSGKVLVIKGGMNIGGDFNYFSNLKFEPSHELCLTVHNGYNPMNVSVNSWYQFWHPSCSEWMERSVWSPMELNWQINDQHRSAWIENECLIRDLKSKTKRMDP